ncbi:MAG: carboxypeptidase-like regulatory domain-containing protein [Planctomycetota bacterium]|nr:carboxypeptidase-like regulatory domain-containing protein [Planctomycetota bacterium]
MKKRTLEFPLATLLLAVMGIWYVTTGRAPEVRDRVVVVQAGGEQVDGVDSEADLAAVKGEEAEPVAERGQAAPQAALEVGGVRAGRAGWWRAPKNSTWAVGRVERPEGTPADETLWVTAQGSRFSEHQDSRDTHTVIAEPDGSFRVAFSGRTHSKGRLWVRGRYCYMDEPLWVHLEDLKEEVVLKPKLGGRLLVKVLPPRVVAFGDGVLDGVSVEAVRGSFPTQTKLKGWAREEGEFEIGGLASGVAHRVLGHSELYADGEVRGISVEAGDTLNVDVPLALGATVAGTVSDANGALLEGARVYHISADQAGQRIPFLKANPESERLTHAGRFELTGVPPGERVLVVEADGFLEANHELGNLRDGERRLAVDVRLDAGRSVGGVILWPDGSPAVGADVRLAQKSDMMGMEVGRIMGEIQAGPDGSFKFPALGDGTCEVTASSLHPDDRPKSGSKLSKLKARRIPRWMARVEDVAPGSHQLALTLTSGNVISGKVADDAGEPIKAFRVTATPEASGFMSAGSMKPVREKFKVEDGEFALQGVQVGRWEVRVTATGYGDSDRQKVSIPGTNNLRFVLARTGVVTGIVRAPDGSGAADARVMAMHGENKTIGVDTDGEGKFIAGNLEPGWVEISASAEGYSGSETQRFQITSAAKREGIVLALKPGAVIVAELHRDMEDRAGRQISLSGPTRRRLETNSAGSVRFDGLDAGQYTVSLAPTGARGGRGRGDWVMRMANSKKADVEVREGEEAFVVLGAPSATAVKVSGTVTRGEEALASALVVAAPEKGDDDLTSAVRADDQGHYELVLDHPGDWRFQVGSSQRELVVFSEVVPGGDNVVINFSLPEGRIEGRVSGPGGRPEEGLRVTLTGGTAPSTGPGEGRGRPSPFAGRSSTTNSDGEYSFKDLAPGDYLIRAGGASGWGFGQAQQSAKLGRVLIDVKVEYADQVQRIDLPLPAAGEITGTVQDSQGGAVSGARIQVIDEAGHNLSNFGNVRSGTDGSFSYKGVGPGTYSVHAEGDTSSPVKQIKMYEGGQESLLLVLKSS